MHEDLADIAEHVRSAATEFFSGTPTSYVNVDAPGFDEAYASMRDEIASLAGDPGSAAEFDAHVKGNASSRRYAVTTDNGRETRVEATLFAVPVSGMADAVAGIFDDSSACVTVSRSLAARGVAHPLAWVAMVPLPVTPMGGALMAPGTLARLNEELLAEVLNDMFRLAEDGVPKGVAGVAVVRRAFGSQVLPPAAHELAHRTVTSRLLVGIRVLPMSVDEERRDFFSEFQGEAESVDDETTSDPHVVWAEAMRREFSGRGVVLDLPSTLPDAAGLCAANTFRDFLDAVGDETGWPMFGTCEEVHLHDDGTLLSACFVRNGQPYGPAQVPTSTVACDPGLVEAAIALALRAGGERLVHDDPSDMPLGLCGEVEEAPPFHAPANDNVLGSRRAR